MNCPEDFEKVFDKVVHFGYFVLQYLKKILYIEMPKAEDRSLIGN